MFCNSLQEYCKAYKMRFSVFRFFVGACMYAAVRALSPLSNVGEFFYASNIPSLALGAITLHTAWQASSTLSSHNAFLLAVALSQSVASLKVSCSTVFMSVNDVICDTASLYTLSGSVADSSAEASDSSPRPWLGVHGISDELKPVAGVPGFYGLSLKQCSGS